MDSAKDRKLPCQECGAKQAHEAVQRSGRRQPDVIRRRLLLCWFTVQRATQENRYWQFAGQKFAPDGWVQDVRVAAAAEGHTFLVPLDQTGDIDQPVPPSLGDPEIRGIAPTVTRLAAASFPRLEH
jgi:hypothetical protein